MAVQFSSGALEEVQRILGKYPVKRAAIMPVLWLAQKEFGHLSAEVQQYVADLLGFPLAWVSGLASFYTMYYKKPIGKYHLQVCTNVSCMLRGAYDMLHYLEKKLGIKAGETTPDGAFSIVEEECLAACANAPMMICGNQYFLDLTEQKLDTIIDDLRRKWQERGGQGGQGGSGGHGAGGAGRTPTGPTRTLFGVGPAPGSKV